MNKGIADEFLRQITGPKGNASEQTRVILVRSNRNLKRFITNALREVEKLVVLVKADDPFWMQVHAAFLRLATLAELHAQHNLEIAARDIAELATRLEQTTASTDKNLAKTFGDFVTYISTMLLRVYIEGSDENCIWELASVEVLLTQSRRQLRVAAHQRKAAELWLN
jgi:hypothetical protein